MTLPIEPARQTQRLAALVAIARAVSAAVADERRLAELVVDAVIRLVGDGTAVWLRSATTTTLVRVGAAHVDPEAAALIVTAPAEITPGGEDDLIAAVLGTGAAAVLGAEDMAAYVDAITPTAPWVPQRGACGTAVMPLRGEGLVHGILLATRDADRPEYGEDEIAFLQALADVAAATLGAAYLLAGSAVAVEEMRRQADLVDQVSDVIMAWDADHQLVTWNAAAGLVYLYTSAEALGCDAHTLLATRFIAVDGEELDRNQITTALAETGGWSGELRQRRADGQEIEVLSSITALFDWQGRTSGAVAVNRDVTDQRHKERLAMRDVLTGLPNRRYLLNYLGEALVHGAHRTEPLAVLFLDLDGFKQVNDTLGHEAGDEVLCATAQRLIGALRRHDVVARLGGDEFVVVAEEVGDRAKAEDVARRLIESAGQPIDVGGGRTATVVPSIGVTLVSPERAGSLRPDDLIREADAAMYVAKRARSGMAFAAA